MTETTFSIQQIVSLNGNCFCFSNLMTQLLMLVFGLEKLSDLLMTSSKSKLQSTAQTHQRHYTS